MASHQHSHCFVDQCLWDSHIFFCNACAPVCIHSQVCVMCHQTITTDRDKKVLSLQVLLCVCLCSQCVYVCKCVCVEAAMCAMMHGPLFLCAGHQIISQSPGLMERGEWWERYLPAENVREGDRWCALMQAGLLFAWHDHLTPETRAMAAQQATADTGLIVIKSTYTVNYCLSWSVGREKKTFFCFRKYFICREVYSSLLCLHLQWAPVILWYINKLTSTWSSIMTFQKTLINETYVCINYHTLTEWENKW